VPPRSSTPRHREIGLVRHEAVKDVARAEERRTYSIGIRRLAVLESGPAPLPALTRYAAPAPNGGNAAITDTDIAPQIFARKYPEVSA
jgi:hypothetical protein